MDMMASAPEPRFRRVRVRGFTLIELMTVMMILAVLVGIALPNYKVSIVQAKETVLRENLFQIRKLIEQYHADRGVYPPSLEDLVTAGYFRQMPIDPITGRTDWEIEFEPSDTATSGQVPGVWNVKSGSSAISLSGTPYNEW